MNKNHVLMFPQYLVSTLTTISIFVQRQMKSKQICAIYGFQQYLLKDITHHIQLCSQNTFFDRRQIRLSHCMVMGPISLQGFD